MSRQGLIVGRANKEHVAAHHLLTPPTHQPAVAAGADTHLTRIKIMAAAIPMLSCSSVNSWPKTVALAVAVAIAVAIAVAAAGQRRAAAGQQRGSRAAEAMRNHHTESVAGAHAGHALAVVVHVQLSDLATVLQRTSADEGFPSQIRLGFPRQARSRHRLSQFESSKDAAVNSRGPAHAQQCANTTS